MCKSYLFPFTNFFWEKKQKYLHVSCKKQICYYPMIIWYCLALQAKSVSDAEIRYGEKLWLALLYYQVKKKRRPQEYNNYIHPKQGFNHEIINELKNKIKDFSDIELFMVILFDKINVQENLVWSKYTSDLIGFDDLGDVNLNYATFQEINPIVPDVLFFFSFLFFLLCLILLDLVCTFLQQTYSKLWYTVCH